MTDLRPTIERLQRNRAALCSAVERLSPALWRQKPQPESWSAGEVIAHLTMVESAIISGATKVLQHPPRHVPLWKRPHVPVAIVEWRGLKRKTPIPLDASLVGEKEPMLESFAALRQKTLAFLEEHRSADLSPYRWPHPFLGYLNLYEWFEVIARHEARHTKQIREIVELFQK